MGDGDGVRNTKFIQLKFVSNQNLTSKLTRSTFEGFNMCIDTDISSNGLQNVPDDLFQGFTMLVLNLGSNDLSTISSKFLNFSTLLILKLNENKFQIIEETTFTNLPMLRLLYLSQNQIQQIQSHSFDNNRDLQVLFLDNNNLKTLPENIFDPLQHFITLRLNDNFFSIDSLSPDIFRNNPRLRKIEISNSKSNLTSLPINIFRFQSNLQQLYLNHSGLMNLPRDLLLNLSKLTDLELTNNYLTTIPDLFFSNCQNLSSLDISGNQITQVSASTFSGLHNLKQLNMAYNRIQHLDSDSFQSMSHLTHIHFNNNGLAFTPVSISKLEMRSNMSPFQYCRRFVQLLDFSNNNISEIYHDWLSAPKLLELNLANNHMTHLSHQTIQLIANASLNTFNSIQGDLDNPDIILSLNGNPIECDCSIYHLIRYQREETSVTSKRSFKILMNDLRCAGPPEQRDIRVMEVNEKSLVCATPSTCPKSCSCSRRAWDQAHLINCSFRGFTEVPAFLPSDSARSIELNLSGNSLQRVSQLSQLSYRNLTVISLSHNHISSLSLQGWSENLTGLYLHENILTQLGKDDILLLASSTRLKNLTLHTNPWLCNCDTFDFLDFIKTNQSNFPELQQVTCSSADTPTFKLTRADVCLASVVPIISGAVTFILLLIAIILAALYYRFKTVIKVWVFAHQLLPWFVNEAEVDEDKVYDAFISYSYQDEDFVVNTLVPKLEEGPRGFKLCLHYRDWPAGEFIADQIERSVTESRRTVVVLSKNFLESEWGKMEFRTAHCSALSEGRVRVIVIIYGDISPIDELEPELASYMRTNTWIQWSDRWFWEKLRYALPHPVDSSKKL